LTLYKLQRCEAPAHVPDNIFPEYVKPNALEIE
jgi:hypothetical protein